MEAVKGKYFAILKTEIPGWNWRDGPSYANLPEAPETTITLTKDIPAFTLIKL